MPELTRRELLLGGSTVGLAAALGGYALGDLVGLERIKGWVTEEPSPVEVRSFVTRPDLRPPAVTVKTSTSGIDPGYVLLTPAPSAPGTGTPLPDGLQKGPLMIDNSGEPVWFAPTSPLVSEDYTNVAADLRVQQYQGRPVLTWWRGDVKVPPGFGIGEYVIADTAYREIAVLRAGGGEPADLHEFLITDRDTALIAIYRKASASRGPVLDCVVQELDIASGRVLFEWRSLDHIAPDESLQPLPTTPGQPYDYFHLNSVAEDGDGALLISARHTQAVYRVDRRTGAVLWRLGGKRSDFRMGPGATFVKQHDARRQPDGTISIFDNAGTYGGVSRAIVLAVDDTGRTAELVREHVSPAGEVSLSQGNAQFLPSGHALVGWGSEPYITEFTQAGNVLFDVTWGGELDSYRAFRSAWRGAPTAPPAAAARPGPGDGMTVYASWNGATEVAQWRFLAGPEPGRMQPVREVPRGGFETTARVGQRQPHVAAQGLNRQGQVLGTSPVVGMVDA